MNPIKHFKKMMNDQGGWIPLALGGAALLGGILNNQVNKDLQNSANQASQDNAREQMAFQERMSNSAYQRSVTDMRAAGLNPMLAGINQSSASTPGGASGSVGAAKMENAIAPAIGSAVQAHSTMENLNIGKSQLQLQQANSAAEIALKAAQVNATTQSAKNAVVQNQILRSEAKSSKLRGDFDDSETGRNLFYIDKINNSVGGILDSTNSALKLANPFKGTEKLLNPWKKGMDGSRTPPAIPRNYKGQK